MSELAHWFSVLSGYICLPAMAVLAIVFYLKNKNKNILVFAIGLSLMVIGQLAMSFFPYASIGLDEFEKIMSESGPPLSWYFGNIIFSLGLLTSVAGLWLITFRTKCVEIKSR